MLNTAQESQPTGQPNLNEQPVSQVIWVSLDKVCPNDYNPNSVARIEMGLLAKSILSDGYTQPIVTIHDPLSDKYVIIDGFHRYYTCKTDARINQMTGGKVPIVVLNKTLSERMASTVRHNRARGKHSVKGMSHMVYEMLKEGMKDSEICNELGMEAEELLRLKHITGYSKLYSKHEYGKSWETKNQIKLRIEHENG